MPPPAAVRCAADERQALEQLCGYITRPALANERVQTNAAGQVVVKLKTPWRDGTTHLVMRPIEFMQLPIAWPVCGDQIHWLYVCSGSAAPVHHLGGRTSRLPPRADKPSMPVLTPGSTRPRRAAYGFFGVWYGASFWNDFQTVS